MEINTGFLLPFVQAHVPDGFGLQVVARLQGVSADDTVVFSDDSQGVIKQDVGVLAWEVSGLYTDKGKLKNKFALTASPPVLHVSSDTGEEMSIALTKDLVRLLGEQCDLVYKAYYGVPPKRRGEGVGFVDYCKNNRAKVVVVALCALVVLMSAVLSWL